MSTNYEAPHCATFSILPYFIPLKSKYSPQHPVLKHPQTPLIVRDQVSDPYKTTGRIVLLYILTFKFLDCRRGSR
jgi:hypothetical protein